MLPNYRVIQIIHTLTYWTIFSYASFNSRSLLDYFFHSYFNNPYLYLIKYLKNHDNKKL
jgi:glycogen synthase